MRLFKNLLKKAALQGVRSLARPAADLTVTLPREQVHVLDRILVVLAQPPASESVRLLVHKMSLREAWFRSFQPVAVGQQVRFDILLDCRSGVRSATGVVKELQPVPGGFDGRLEMEPGAEETHDLVRWLQTRSRTLAAGTTVRAGEPAPWALVS